MKFKMAQLRPNTFMVTLNVNGLSVSIKRQKLAELSGRNSLQIWHEQFENKRIKRYIMQTLIKKAGVY